MSLSAIRRVEPTNSLRNQIGQSLSAAIVSGELAPGTLVSVPTLAAQFSVSATPVREAMLDLEQRGFVESVRNKGFRVTAVSEKDLREIIELRQLLEAPAMAAIAKDFPAEAVPEWRAIAEKIAEHARNEDLAGFIDMDRQFHLGLLALYGNARLVDSVRELRNQTRMVNLVRMSRSPELATVADEHFILLDLLSAGDSDGAEALIEQHLSHIIGWWANSDSGDAAHEAAAGDVAP